MHGDYHIVWPRREEKYHSGHGEVSKSHDQEGGGGGDNMTRREEEEEEDLMDLRSL